MVCCGFTKWKIGMGVRNCSPIEMVRMVKHGRRDVIVQKEYYKHPLTGIYQSSFHLYVISVKIDYFSLFPTISVSKHSTLFQITSFEIFWGYNIIGRQAG